MSNMPTAEDTFDGYLLRSGWTRRGLDWQHVDRYGENTYMGRKTALARQLEKDAYEYPDERDIRAAESRREANTDYFGAA